MAYEFIPHPSDMGVRGIGRTVEEAFSEAARAMFSLMADLERIEPKEAVPFEVEAETLEDLFVRFLAEFLFLRDTHGMLFSRFLLRVERIGSKFRAVGQAWGEKFDPQKHRAGIDVKAATYNWVKVEEQNGTWIAQGVVDV
ncbi:MAG: archease [Candidatus Bipolaricaulota bacterium]|nr:archease [Candidatus Bipolaricaulota bacterium]MDW8127388.1 archease [Candidatus Bipolaricaulota bacterium]